MKAPDQIGRYPVLGRLASGGMAEILLAKVVGPAGFERPVVIKRVLPHLADEDEFRSMFLDEARIAAALHHPNVVHVQELGTEDGELFLVMEYLGGENVSAIIKTLAANGATLDLGAAAYVIAEACAGLHAAHELKAPDGEQLHIVHRDVSPQNVLVTYEGAVKVLDFGIAKARQRYTRTRTGQLKGKFAYMAPEQCRNLEVDRRADLFALGAVLYELTTGDKVFGRPTELGTIMAITEEVIQAPEDLRAGYPSSLSKVVMKALARDPDERYQTAAEMRTALLEVAREIAPDVDLEAQLAIEMHKLFAEAIAEKREMLLRADDEMKRSRRSGTFARKSDPEENGPESPSLDGLRVPGPPLLPKEVRSGKISTDPDLVHYEEERTKPLRIATAAIAVALTIALLLAFSLLGGGDAEIAESPHSERAISPAPPPERSAPLPSTVEVHVQTEPEDAEILIAGEPRGRSPLRLELPRGEESLTITLRKEGFVPLEQNVVPDMDQRLRLSLSPHSPSSEDETAPSEGDGRPSRARRRVRRRETRPRSESMRPSGFYAFE